MSDPGPARDPDGRIAGHARMSAALAAYDDTRLAALTGTARPGRTGAGGTSARLDVDGTPVFVKRIPLTDRERRAVGSTANLSGLPAHCHFGVGSPGFGAWRELAATATASDWVLGRRTGGFPLLYHWRVLPGADPPGDELADVETAVARWGGSPAVRDRLDALADASASLVLFLEHIPSTVARWLASRVAAGEDAALAAAAMLETELLAGAAYMNARGLIHFDAHFDNVLTDGRHLYFADLGLAVAPGFALSADEVALVGRTRTHDIGYVIARLVNWLVSAFGDPSYADDPIARNDRVRACARGAGFRGLPATVAETVRRYAPIATIVNDFHAELFTVRRDARYPAGAIGRELARLAGADRLPAAVAAAVRPAAGDDHTHVGSAG